LLVEIEGGFESDENQISRRPFSGYDRWLKFCFTESRSEVI